jgi:hypothetical protein
MEETTENCSAIEVRMKYDLSLMDSVKGTCENVGGFHSLTANKFDKVVALEPALSVDWYQFD